ncbi:MAG: hypothetical protein QF473_37110, partial [Planctomycetota bacterium]|nr:hypothetical protein [Planctomycetota bacterium]
CDASSHTQECSLSLLPSVQFTLNQYITLLKYASDDGFGYSPDSTDRQAGLKKWEEWAAQATAPLLSGDFEKKIP